MRATDGTLEPRLLKNGLQKTTMDWLQRGRGKGQCVTQSAGRNTATGGAPPRDLRATAGERAENARLRGKSQGDCGGRL